MAAARLATKNTRPKAGAVVTRNVNELPSPAAALAAEAEATGSLSSLWAQVMQVTDPSIMKPKFRTYTPEQAQNVMLTQDSLEVKRQRKRSEREVRRWSILIETGRFVDYFPGAPVCFDAAGNVMNGQHRLAAVARGLRPVGFLVVTNVPDFMFAYFDTGLPRTINHVFQAAGKQPQPQVGSTLRLAMRYREFLLGLRPPIGWKEWQKFRDEHSDVAAFGDQHEGLLDLYLAADANYKASRVTPSSLMVWRYYQEMAWPQGAKQVMEFFEQLKNGTDMPLNHPAWHLREWAKDVALRKERITAKRELDLLLLNKMFAAAMRKERPEKMTYAHGFAMTVPYHPKGQAAALTAIKAELARIAAASTFAG